MISNINFSSSINLNCGVLENYFHSYVIMLLSPLLRGLSPQCQMLLFSATYDTSVMEFAEKVIPNDPVIIKLRREEESLENIKQYYIECHDQEEKFIALANIYGAISIGQSMIFCAVRNKCFVTYLIFLINCFQSCDITKN